MASQGQEPSRTPVIVGVGQITDTTSSPADARPPLGLMLDAARLAGADSGAGATLLRGLDSIAVVRLFADSSPRFKSPFGSMVNPPWSLAGLLDAKPADMVYAPPGGDSPQVLLTRACEAIAAGQSQSALVVGAEALRTELAAKRAGLALDWSADAPSLPDDLGGFSLMYKQCEIDHGMRLPVAMYALIEQRIRVSKGRTPAQHLAELGKLFERFAAVARDNPLATRRGGYSATDIVTPTGDNRMIAYPYTRLMTASAFVDQSAALLVCSEARADELGIDRSRRVYLHGYGKAHDEWFVTDRPQINGSPATRAVVGEALSMAGQTLAGMDAIDIYSCFTAAVQSTCDALGLSADDPRGFTLTGGLAFFGGPGNNFVTHSIAQMVTRLRSTPGKFGLVTANGGLVTKHAAGVFSTARPAQPWPTGFHSTVQARLDQAPKARFTEQPGGDASIESYTVVHGKTGPDYAVVIGRQAGDDARFVAHTPVDAAVFNWLQSVDAVGARGKVVTGTPVNRFVPDLSSAR